MGDIGWLISQHRQLLIPCQIPIAD